MARRTQHRQQRDSNKQDVAKLKQEVQTLRRQLARANREVGRMQGVAEPEPEPEEPVKKKKQESCPMCGSTDLGIVTTPLGKTIVSCKGCKKWRQSR